MTRFNPANITALQHTLTEKHGDLSRYGVPMPLPKGLMTKAGRVVLAIAAADGKVSPRERETLLGIMRAFGTSPDEVDALRTFDPSKTTLEALLKEAPRSILRALSYDAIRVASADGFDDKERAAAEKMAERIGVEPGFVRGAEALLKVEDAVNMSRLRVITPPEQHPEAWTGNVTQQGEAARAAMFGPQAATALPTEFYALISKAILTVAAGDKDLSEAELTWFVGQAKTMGAPDEAIEAALKFDAVGANIEEVVDERLMPYARVVIYDALRTARADGVTGRERDLALRAAERLGLEANVVHAIESQIEIEAAVREARITLLAPLK